jgi:hypothetical protein
MLGVFRQPAGLAAGVAQLIRLLARIRHRGLTALATA